MDHCLSQISISLGLRRGRRRFDGEFWLDRNELERY